MSYSAEVAQSVEQRTENPRVVGSIPTLGTSFFSIPEKLANVTDVQRQV